MKDHNLALRGAMVCMHQIHDFMPYFGPDINSLSSIILKDCANAGLNCLLVEYEAMFPYRGEHSRISNRDAFSVNEIENFCAEADRLDIQIIPLVQTLGHVYHILCHEEYSGLREVPEHIQQCCPGNPDTMKLARELIDDIIDSHPQSEYIHLGGDECGLLGTCPHCAEIAAKDPAGKYRVYVNYYRELTDYVISRGKIPIIWHDIAVKEPELLREFNEKVVFHFWNYGDHCHGVLEEHFRVLNNNIPASRIIGGAGIRGESGHGSLLLSPTLALDNISRMNKLMIRENALGSIVTDWPDCGTFWMNSLSFFAAHGFSAAGGEIDRSWRENFAAEYFGVDIPEWFDRYDSFYGPVPLADGFQMRLASYLNRYEFKKFDLNKIMERIIQGEKAIPGYGNIFWYCHRRFILREWIGKMEQLSAQITRHKPEFISHLLTFKAVEFLLSLSLGCIMRYWDEHDELCVGYQLTPSLKEKDLARAADDMKTLGDEISGFYSRYSPSLHVKQFVRELFKEEFRTVFAAVADK